MRFEKLDIGRGIAIILMVIFHLNYSLVNIFSNNVLHFSEVFWFILGKVAALLFIFIAGISFFLAEQKHGTKVIGKYLKTSVVLWIIAGGISSATFFLFPDQYIRFGIIHFFALSFLLLLVCRKLKYYNMFFGSIIIIYGIFFIPVIQNQYLYFLGFTYPGFSSADFYPIFPYFGAMLLGYVLALYLKDTQNLKILKIIKIQSDFWKYVGKAGRHSLIIYVLHQPIIIGIIWVLYYRG